MRYLIKRSGEGKSNVGVIIHSNRGVALSLITITILILTIIVIATLTLAYNHRMLLRSSMTLRTENWYAVKAGVVDAYARIEKEAPLEALDYKLDVNQNGIPDVKIQIFPPDNKNYRRLVVSSIAAR